MLDIDCDLKKLYFYNRSLEEPWYFVFMALYGMITIISFLSNALLLIALHRFSKNRSRRQNRLSNQNLLIRPLKPVEITRDRLIFHLAVLDILLSFTMPLTALDALSKFWPFGKNTTLLCQATKSSPSIVVYSSSMLIVVIALNCYRQIVIPHKKQLQPNSLKFVTAGIIFLGSLMSIPQFYNTRLFELFENETSQTENGDIATTIRPLSSGSRTTIMPTNISFSSLSAEGSSVKKERDTCEEYDQLGWSHIVFCIEDWPFGEEYLDPKGRLNYSIFTFAIQLVIPLTIISYCYHSVYRTLQSHSHIRRTILNPSLQSREKLQRENRQSNRRNRLIAVISLVYLALWLPLGIINLILDSNPDALGKDMSRVTMVVLSCHLIGMCSAIANPIIYGYTNKRIRKGNILLNITSAKCSYSDFI